MITLTLNVPDNDTLIGAGLTGIRVSKSTSATAAGPYVAVSPDLVLVLGTTTYTFMDIAGNPGDWYVTQYLAGGTASSPSAPQPAYLSSMCGTIRDLLGVTTSEITDTQIMDYAYLPTALARVRGRLPTFDSLVSGGGDSAALCLGALAHYTASLLCPRMTVAVMDAEQMGQYKYQRNRQLDWTATAQLFLDQYNVLISLAAGEVATNTAMYGTGMVLAGPTRAGNDNPGLVPFNPDPLLENPLLPYNVIPPVVP